MPDEDMTAFLQHTLSTFTAHREEIEGLIKIRDGCCDKYLESNDTRAPPTILVSGHLIARSLPHVVK